MIVVDASVMVALLGHAPDVDEARASVAEEDQHAPHLLDAEVGSALRSIVHHGRLPADTGAEMLADLAGYPLVRHRHDWLLPRAWELRDNLTLYDGIYVALAELLNARLVTADRRLARAPGTRCDVTLLGPP